MSHLKNFIVIFHSDSSIGGEAFYGSPLTLILLKRFDLNCFDLIWLELYWLELIWSVLICIVLYLSAQACSSMLMHAHACICIYLSARACSGINISLTNIFQYCGHSPKKKNFFFFYFSFISSPVYSFLISSNLLLSSLLYSPLLSSSLWRYIALQ